MNNWSNTSNTGPRQVLVTPPIAAVVVPVETLVAPVAAVAPVAPVAPVVVMCSKCARNVDTFYTPGFVNNGSTPYNKLNDLF
jgi:hypothetical protein